MSSALDSQLADNAAQVPFHHQPDQALALLLRLGQKLLRRGQNRRLVAAHLDLRHRFHRHRHALPGVEVLLRRHVEAHQFQAQLAAVFHHGPDDRAVTLDDARAAEPVYDQGLVGPSFAIHPGQQSHEQNKHQCT
jgi:hypothetical protein